MEKKATNQIILWSLLTGGATALFWTIYHLITGAVPVVSALAWGEEIVFNLPFALSRWWDIMLGPIFGSAFILLRATRWAREKKGELEIGLVFGLGCGLLSVLCFGIVFGQLFPLTFGLTSGGFFVLAFTFGLILILGINGSLALSLGLGLGYVLACGLFVGWAFVLLLFIAPSLVFSPVFVFQARRRRAAAPKAAQPQTNQD